MSWLVTGKTGSQFSLCPGLNCWNGSYTVSVKLPGSEGLNWRWNGRLPSVADQLCLVVSRVLLGLGMCSGFCSNNLFSRRQNPQRDHCVYTPILKTNESLTFQPKKCASASLTKASHLSQGKHGFC